MGIDISKLEGLMKTLATLSDVENKDGQIEGKKEVSIFKGYAENALLAGQITDDEYKTIKQNAINMAMRLREGHYTKAALDQIVKQVM